MLHTQVSNALYARISVGLTVLPVLPHLGAGAGQAMEDGWILGRCLHEYVHDTDRDRFGTLEGCASYYQQIRKPRAQKVQRTSRLAGDSYDMQSPDMLEKEYNECVEIMAERTRTRMKFVWEEDLDLAYENGKKEANVDENYGGKTHV